MKILSCLLLVILSLSAFAQKGQPVVIAHSFQLESPALKEKRTINIYLPEDYNAKDTTKYPVIYIIDGGVEEDFIHVTGIVRFNTQPWINRFPRSIVVGIENTNRRRDCTFAVPDLNFLDKMGFKKESFPAYGGSAKYIAFLEKELQPWMKYHYNTNGTNTLIGESLAGLLATEILLKHRDLFSNYIIMSPSLWWGNESLLTEAPQLLKSAANKPVNVYVGACSKDEDKVMYDDAISLREVLQQHGGAATKVFYDYLPDEIHSTMMHQAVYNAFKLIYPQTALQK
ncbi:alpha/beta hydrolase [Pseudoflavitalea sp. G-6-1-2]|uniref:alpha/beta hydrolase n=1 Tax=Pseudoflavitalea sp. G-6-1-2 TaxID=2728841 RepID=UPI00146BD880|nr:alpha/beta hydrolase-fold protein [Pseudoflavitalea sp. G-6-1-2]NML21944.1 alpha/beta hydrolase [Pseudoflavitalea sp. G-6-1-2]